MFQGIVNTSCYLHQCVPVITKITCQLKHSNRIWTHLHEITVIHIYKPNYYKYFFDLEETIYRKILFCVIYHRLNISKITEVSVSRISRPRVLHYNMPCRKIPKLPIHSPSKINSEPPHTARMQCNIF